MESTLSKEEQRILLNIARRVIVESIAHERDWYPESEEGRIAEPRGAFVTLERRGRLRGCVGQPAAQHSLARTVAHCALAAAREDYRFRPIRADELAELTIEISVLSSMQPLVPGQIEIGRHGLFVVQGKFRGLLLPRVAAERDWNAERFLAETCRKAGIPSSSWQWKETQLYCFTAEVFTDAAFVTEAASATIDPAP